jgi:ubiquinone/menaquinone biosynthesis C-methylase UbiE
VDARLQRRIQRYGWDRAEEIYERCWAEQLRPAQERLLARAEIAPGEAVLDIACGTGLGTFPAAERVGPGGRVLATDLSERMVERVRGEARRRGLTQVAAERSDAEELPCAEGSFDVALCSLGLMYVPDPVAALVQMRRALRPGGRAVASVWGARSRCGWAEIFPIVDARVESEVCPLFFQLGTGDALEDAFGRAGFGGLACDRLSVELPYDSPAEALAAAFAGGPVALAYSRFDEATREAAHDEYLASIAPFRDGAGYRIPGEFVVVRGERHR